MIARAIAPCIASLTSGVIFTPLFFVMNTYPKVTSPRARRQCRPTAGPAQLPNAVDERGGPSGSHTGSAHAADYSGGGFLLRDIESDVLIHDSPPDS